MAPMAWGKRRMAKLGGKAPKWAWPALEAAMLLLSQRAGRPAWPFLPSGPTRGTARSAGQRP
jgi:hypothetical protein